MTDYLELVEPVADAPHPTGAHFDRDPRNDEHPLSLVVSDLPAAGRSQPWERMAGIWDQAPENRCVVEGIAGLAVTRPWVDLMTASQLAIALSSSHQDGRQWVYKVAQRLDGIEVAHEGTTPTAGYKAARVADLQPSRDDTVPGHVGEWGYAWAGGIDEVVSYLSGVGPMTAAVKWLHGMWEPDITGTIHATGSVEGAHLVVVDWHDDANQRFRIANSWGTAWGFGGYAYISRDNLADLLADGGQISGWYRR